MSESKAKEPKPVEVSEPTPEPAAKRRRYLPHLSKKLVILLAVLLLVFVGAGLYKHFHAPKRTALTHAQAQARFAKLATTPDQKAKAYVREGITYQYDKDYSKAIASYKSAAKADPNAIAPWNSLCTAYFAAKDKQGVLDACQHAKQMVQQNTSSPYANNVPLWDALIKQVQNGNFEMPKLSAP